jgi:hypothetical protein
MLRIVGRLGVDGVWRDLGFLVGFLIWRDFEWRFASEVGELS